jgi:hypothetical protein
VHLRLTAPSQPARNVTASWIASTLSVSWQAPVSTALHGVLVGYSVQYKLLASGQTVSVCSDTQVSFLTEPLVGAGILNHSLADAQTTEHYVIRVAAVTSAGTGPYSACVDVPAVTTQDTLTAALAVGVAVSVSVLVVAVILAAVWVVRARRHKRVAVDHSTIDLASAVGMCVSCAVLTDHTNCTATACRRDEGLRDRP